ncbi:hypothetical protein LINPERPRIM_LOCUS25564, partial [Linum perenne]
LAADSSPLSFFFSLASFFSNKHNSLFLNKRAPAANIRATAGRPYLRLSLYRPLLSLSLSKRRTRERTTPGSAHGGGGGSESDAVTISPPPPPPFLRSSRRRQEAQHATQKTKSDDGASKTKTSAAGRRPSDFESLNDES